MPDDALAARSMRSDDGKEVQKQLAQMPASPPKVRMAPTSPSCSVPHGNFVPSAVSVPEDSQLVELAAVGLLQKSIRSCDASPASISSGLKSPPFLARQSCGSRSTGISSSCASILDRGVLGERFSDEMRDIELEVLDEAASKAARKAARKASLRAADDKTDATKDRPPRRSRQMRSPSARSSRTASRSESGCSPPCYHFHQEMNS